MDSDLYHLCTSVIPPLQIVDVFCAIAGLGLIAYNGLRKREQRLKHIKKLRNLKREIKKDSKRKNEHDWKYYPAGST